MATKVYFQHLAPDTGPSMAGEDLRRFYVCDTIEELEAISTAAPTESGRVGSSVYTWDGAAWTQNAGSTTHAGTVVVDFGAFPGASDASAVVTGQTGITAESIVEAWISPVATSDHSADEHVVETLACYAGNIVEGVGFTVYLRNTNQIDEPNPLVPPPGTMQQSSATAVTWKAAVPGRRPTTRAPLIYGEWTVAWRWT